jgi:hypothetical protein
VSDYTSERALGSLQDGRRLETRTTALEHRSCGHCRCALTGHKLRFCSDRCRMRDRRQRERARIDELLKRLEDNLAALRAALVAEVEP